MVPSPGTSSLTATGLDRLRMAQKKKDVPERKRRFSPKSRTGCITCRLVAHSLITTSSRLIIMVGFAESNVARKSHPAFGARQQAANAMATCPQYPQLVDEFSPPPHHYHSVMQKRAQFIIFELKSHFSIPLPSTLSSGPMMFHKPLKLSRPYAMQRRHFPKRTSPLWYPKQTTMIGCSSPCCSTTNPLISCIHAFRNIYTSHERIKSPF